MNVVDSGFNFFLKRNGVKSSRNKKDLKDITAAPFFGVFFSAASSKKNTVNGAAVTSLRSFLFLDDFNTD